MSRISSGLFGLAAVAALAAASFHIASSEAFGFSLNATAASPAATADVNRVAKSDRAPVAAAAGGGATLVYQLSTLPAMSFATRYAAQPNALSPRSDDRSRKMVACEGVVSVLTEIADKLAPGRCVT
jgi:hypothetical protein